MVIPKSVEVLYLSMVFFKVSSLGSYILMEVRLPLFQTCLKLDSRWQREQGILGMVEIFCILILVVVPGVHTTVKTHCIVHFKWMEVIVHKLFFNKVDMEKNKLDSKEQFPVTLQAT